MTSEEANPTRPVLDHARIDLLIQHIGEQTFFDIAARFREDVGNEVAALIQEAPNLEAVRRRAHGIAGIAGNFGCVELEYQSRRLLAADSVHPEALADLQAAASRAIDAFDQRLARR